MIMNNYNYNADYSVWDSQELSSGQASQGDPHARPREQQQDALDTPTPISVEQSRLSE